MADLIQVGDFVGMYELAQNGLNSVKLAYYITDKQSEYLRKTLGVELYDLFIQGVEDEDPIYEILFEPFAYQQDGCIIESKGIKNALLGIVYFYYQRDKQVQQTVNSAVKMRGQNSERAEIMSQRLFGRYNDSIRTLKAVQQYCMDNSDVYPTFQGVQLDYSYQLY